MARLISAPIVIPSPGTPPKVISEFVGRVATERSWSEPGQRPEFDEYTVVLAGELRVETEDGSFSISKGQAVHVAAGEWVRYSTPAEGGAHYVSVCRPAFSPDTVHRDP